MSLQPCDKPHKLFRVQRNGVQDQGPAWPLPYTSNLKYIEQDQLSQAQMTSQTGSLTCYALLHTAISGNDESVISTKATLSRCR